MYEHLKIRLEDIKSVTNNFSNPYNHCGKNPRFIRYVAELDHFDREKSSSIGREGDVKLLKRHDIVAIKRLIPQDDERDQEVFFNNMEMLASFQHPNIITLLGFCVEGSELILVFEKNPNGHHLLLCSSLENNNHRCTLTWEKRLKIAIDIAHALNYLHFEREDKKVIIHNGTNCCNICLDENWGAKIENFEDAEFRTPTQEEEALDIPYLSRNASPFHLDPEYIETHVLKRESDVYSFGVVLFELLCGKKANDPIYLKDGGLQTHVARRRFAARTLESMIDPVIIYENNHIRYRGPNKDSLDAYTEIAYKCVAETQAQRPTMKLVLKELEKSLMFQENDKRGERPTTMGVLTQHKKEKGQHPNTNQAVNKLERLREILGKNLEPLMIPLSDIKLATNDFSLKCIHKGSMECTLYKAELKHYGKENLSFAEGNNKGQHPNGRSTVLIKRYNDVNRGEDFFTEIKMLTIAKHHNIITIFGLCVEGFEMILVIDNVSNGYLDDYLGKVNSMRDFTWEKRLKICIDVAHALKYLHSEMKDQNVIINHAIRSNTIGLDENWGAKIIEFGRSICLHHNPKFNNTGEIIRESDVYSFGIVLFEILCGRPVDDQIYNKGSHSGLATIATRSFLAGTLEDMMDPILKKQTIEYNFILNRGPDKDSLRTFMEIAYKCVTPKGHPILTMKEVVIELEKSLKFQKSNKDNPRLSLEDIIQATKNFHKNNCIGGGGFGGVFKGTIQDGGQSKTIVAKRLDTSLGQGEQQFLTELQIVLKYKHENVIGLVGYCDEKGEKIIVYEYADKGSLDRYLSDVSLTWIKRLNICIDVARALYFLHGGFAKQAKVIHRDIKAANILLNLDWKAKLTDFGLSLITPLVHEKDYVIDHWCGTPGYLDPLYKESGFLTTESDIYSFGVVLFEILYGRSAYAVQKQDGHSLQNAIRNNYEEGKLDALVLEQIREQIAPKSLTTFQEIAYRCLHIERKKRPTTKEVLTQLKKAMKFQEMASRMTKFAHLQIPLDDVVKATNNFHQDNIVTCGGSGITYKGQILQSGRLTKIAARRFDCKHGEGDLELLAELSALSDLKNTNLVSVIGYCDEKDEKIIITPFEDNGNLTQYLNNRNLTWTQRLRICLGVARALSYLHYDEGRGYAIIHCNINSNTILLDENLEAKLSCFETSIKQVLCYEDHVCWHCYQTNSYFAIENTVAHKSDVHSLGVVLFEMLCGGNSFIQSDAKRLLDPLTLQDIILPNLWNQISQRSLIGYSTAANTCLEDNQIIKYSIACSGLEEKQAHTQNAHNIVQLLEKALESQLQHEVNMSHINNLEHLKIPLNVIKLATNNFSLQCIGSTQLYCRLYIARLSNVDMENHSFTEGENGGELHKRPNDVIIKRFPDIELGDQAVKIFFREIKMLSSVKHHGIVRLLGFCVEGPEMILVIENTSNGYLYNYLEKPIARRILTWEKRLKICIDVARTLCYLHYEMEDQKIIINHYISSWNIGLDENWGAKIVDFGFSLFLLPNQDDKAVFLEMFRFGNKDNRGFLPPNIDPEYVKTRQLRRESDIYSFGVVMLEILFGGMAYDPIYWKDDEKGLASMARRSYNMGTLEDMIDPIIKEETSGNNSRSNIGPNKDSLHTFIEIALQCVAEAQDQRPTIKIVVKELEKALFQISRAKSTEEASPQPEMALSYQVYNKENSKISLEDIKLATRNFHEDNCVGEKGFSKVYKGNLQHGDGVNTIAAKRLDSRSGQGEKDFLSELKILEEFKHENIIDLLGYCDEQDEKIIVYEFASKGSLDRYLNDASLTWLKRLNICIDVASALDFIHGGVGKHSKVIHGDIKTANILLNNDWRAKLTNFGLSLISPITRETEYACDTSGYVDPQYKKSRFLTIESDIYSFGVVLFEILCGRSTFAVYKHDSHYLPDFIKNGFEEGKHDEVVFEQIREQIMPESLTAYQTTAYQCLHHEIEKRPSTEEVLMQLQMAMAFQISKETSTKEVLPQPEMALSFQLDESDDSLNNVGKKMTTLNSAIPEAGDDTTIEIEDIKSPDREANIQEIVEFYNSEKNCTLSLIPGNIIFKDFWKNLLKLQKCNGWLESDHMWAWTTYLFNTRQSDACWTILPVWYKLQTTLGNGVLQYGDGSEEPYPSIKVVDKVYIPLNVENMHWVLVCYDLKEWTLTVYDSLRTVDGCRQQVDNTLIDLNYSFGQWLCMLHYFPQGRSRILPFKRVMPENLPQQKGDGDCGVWVCLYLDRLINEKPLYNQNEDTLETAKNFRERLARLCFEHRISCDVS